MEKIEVERFVAKKFQTAEAIKTLRTNILFSGKDIKSIAITSYGTSGGKTSVAFQLAASMAQAGKRVLLLDTDLRKSVLASRLRVRGSVKGLSHFLSGMSEMNDLMYGTNVDGMYIMFSGPRVPNAAELLGSNRFACLISGLEKVFDYVIVDAAPLGQVIDCAVMAPVLDGVLIIVDARQNSYKLERRIIAQLEKSGGKIMGIVLNHVDLRDKQGYYGKAYGYSYGYGYEE